MNKNVDLTHQYEDGQVMIIAQRFPAGIDGVSMVNNAEIESGNGRSIYHWFRLANGDLILGVYPQGDTYTMLEGIVERDYASAITPFPEPTVTIPVSEYERLCARPLGEAEE